MTSRMNTIRTKRKKTIATTFRGDIRTIASLASFWHQKGETVASLNDVLRLSVEGLCDLIVNKDPSLKILSVSEAARILEVIGIFDLSKKFLNKKTLIDELSIESLIAERTISLDEERRILRTPFKSKEEKVDYTDELRKQMKEPDDETA